METQNKLEGIAEEGKDMVVLKKKPLLSGNKEMKWPEDFVNKIIQGDCLEVMKLMKDKSVDLVLTDPPYGIGINKKDNSTFAKLKHIARKPNSETWDNRAMERRYFDEIFRISKNQIVFGANYYWDYFYSTQCYIIWDKVGSIPIMIKNYPFALTEFAWTSFIKRMSKRYVIRNVGFIRDSNDIREEHPTQKPTELFGAILNDFSNEGDLILDPFLGSGTTAVACKMLKRNYIGIEISPVYCKIAEERLRTCNPLL